MTRSLSRRCRSAALLAGVGVAIAWATPGLAQVTPPGPMRPEGTSIGPSAGLQLFTLDVTGKIEYDNNVARGQTEVAGFKALHKDDVIYEPSVSVDLNKQLGRQEVFLTGLVGYDFYQYNDQLNRDRINLLGGVRARLARCAGTLTAGFSQQQTDQEYLPLQVTQNVQTTESAGVQLQCGRGRLGEFVSVQYVNTNNDAGDAGIGRQGLVNSQTVSASTGLTYQNKLLGVASGFLSYSSSDYGDNNDPLLPTASGFHSYGAGISLERPIGARLKGSAQISYQKSETEGVSVAGSSSTFSSFSAQGSLNYRVNSRLNLDLLFVREVQPTIQQGSNFSVVSNASLNGHYQLSSRLSASAGFSWHNIDYEGLTIPVGSPLRADVVTSDSGESFYGALTMKVGRKGSLTLDAREETRNTNLTIFNYTDFRVGVTATQSF